ncbi:MAG: hypothetical protein RLY78_2020 [Pseudomonadota bacterium]
MSLPDDRVLLRTALPEGRLHLQAVRGHEALGRLFEYQLSVRVDQRGIDVGRLLGTRAGLEIGLPAGRVRHIDGLVTAVELDDADADGRLLYRIELRPWLWQLQWRSDSRAFQQLTLIEILRQVFRPYAHDVSVETSARFEPIAHCLQWRETDLAFVLRLLAGHGLYHYFRHAQGRHTLVLVDAPTAHRILPGGALLHWGHASPVPPGATLVRRWRARTMLTGGNLSPSRPTAQADLPETHVEGRSGSRGLAPGHRFALRGHPLPVHNVDHLVVSAQLTLQRLDADDATAPQAGRGASVAAGLQPTSPTAPAGAGADVDVDADADTELRTADRLQLRQARWQSDCGFIAIAASQPYPLPAPAPAPWAGRLVTARVASVAPGVAVPDAQGRLPLVFDAPERGGRGMAAEPSGAPSVTTAKGATASGAATSRTADAGDARGDGGTPAPAERPLWWVPLSRQAAALLAAPLWPDSSSDGGAPDTSPATGPHTAETRARSLAGASVRVEFADEPGRQPWITGWLTPLDTTPPGSMATARPPQDARMPAQTSPLPQGVTDSGPPTAQAPRDLPAVHPPASTNTSTNTSTNISASTERPVPAADAALRLRPTAGAGRQLWLEAQQDLHAHVPRDHWQVVAGQVVHHVGGVLHEDLRGGVHSHIHGPVRREVHGELHLRQAADVRVQVDGQTDLLLGDLQLATDGGLSLRSTGPVSLHGRDNLAARADGALHLHSGGHLVIEAGTLLTLRCGDASLMIGPQDVTINGQRVSLDGGGVPADALRLPTRQPVAPLAPQRPPSAPLPPLD